MAKVGILGAGSWALGIAILLKDNGHDVTLWSAISDEIDILKESRTNPKYLPGVVLDPSITLTHDEREATCGKDILVLAVASKYVRETSRKIAGYISEGQIIVNVAKGIEEGTLMTLTEIIK